ncbi:protein yebF, partial [Yersinia pestis PY-32]
MYRLFFI